jgi:hypothetical protein
LQAVLASRTFHEVRVLFDVDLSGVFDVTQRDGGRVFLVESLRLGPR